MPRLDTESGDYFHLDRARHSCRFAPQGIERAQPERRFRLAYLSDRVAGEAECDKPTRDVCPMRADTADRLHPPFLFWERRLLQRPLEALEIAQGEEELLAFKRPLRCVGSMPAPTNEDRTATYHARQNWIPLTVAWPVEGAMVVDTVRRQSGRHGLLVGQSDGVRPWGLGLTAQAEPLDYRPWPDRRDWRVNCVHSSGGLKGAGRVSWD